MRFFFLPSRCPSRFRLSLPSFPCRRESGLTNCAEGAPHHGFTLLEVLIATAIFAVISGITFQGIQASMNVQERVEGRAQELTELQLVWTVLFQDFVNMTRRPVREEGASGKYPAFDLEPDDGDCVVSFTRAGLPRTSALPAGMQRLAYCLRGGDLYRVVWPVLDRPSDVEPQESLLMEEVEGFTVETYPDDFNPADEKEGSDASRRTLKDDDLPVGVAVMIEHGGRTLERWFPGGEEYRLDVKLIDDPAQPSTTS